jgi:hypothetical protein
MLVDRIGARRITLLSGLSAGLTVLTAATTLLDRNVYNDALMPSLLLGTLGFDAMSLTVGIALIGCLWAIERGREQYWLLWIGLQAYLLYAYSMFAFGLVYTRLYLLYIAIVGLSAYALAGFALHFRQSSLRALPPTRLPRKTLGTTLLVIAGLFSIVWTVALLDALARGEEIAGGIVLVLDLPFALPLLAIVGVLLFRKRPLGDLLAPGVFAMSAAITLGVAVGEFMRPLFHLPFSLWPATPYLIPGSVCLAFALLAFRRVAPGLVHRH